MWKPLCCIVVACLVTGGCCTANQVIASQPVPVIGQETSQWCWAAGGEMCMDFLGTNVAQCDEANKRFGMTNCCNNPVPNACVLAGWPQFNKYNFTVDVTSGGTPLSWNSLRHQIDCRKSPFCFSWGWSGGGGHLMVATGYFAVGGQNYVVINDPLPVGAGSQYVRTYARFVSGPNYVHWIDHYNITKQ